MECDERGFYKRRGFLNFFMGDTLERFIASKIISFKHPGAANRPYFGTHGATLVEIRAEEGNP